MMTAASRLPKKPIRRFKPYKSYNKYLGKPPGLVYGPHCPEIAEMIDRLELTRLLLAQRNEQLAGLIVAAYHKKNPSIEVKGKKIKITLPQWQRLPQEVKALLYSIAACELGQPLNHYATFHLDDHDVSFGHVRDEGPARLVGNFINKSLLPIYSRAQLPLSYLYIMETAPLYENDNRGDLLNTRSSLDSFHVSLAIRVPEQIKVGVLRAFSRFGKTPIGNLYTYNSGYNVHLAKISDDRIFDRGDDQTGRNGLLGRSDYSAKGFRQLYRTRNFYREHAIEPLPLDKWTHASRDIQSKAKKTYEYLRSILMKDPEKAWNDAISKFPGNRFKQYEKRIGAGSTTSETLARIAACDSNLNCLLSAYYYLDDIRSSKCWKEL
jgi:hypothetical protein